MPRVCHHCSRIKVQYLLLLRLQQNPCLACGFLFRFPNFEGLQSHCYFLSLSSKISCRSLKRYMVPTPWHRHERNGLVGARAAPFLSGCKSGSDSRGTQSNPTMARWRRLRPHTSCWALDKICLHYVIPVIPFGLCLHFWWRLLKKYVHLSSFYTCI